MRLNLCFPGANKLVFDFIIDLMTDLITDILAAL